MRLIRNKFEGKKRLKVKGFNNPNIKDLLSSTSISMKTFSLLLPFVFFLEFTLMAFKTNLLHPDCTNRVQPFFPAISCQPIFVTDSFSFSFLLFLFSAILFLEAFLFFKFPSYCLWFFFLFSFLPSLTTFTIALLSSLFLTMQALKKEESFPQHPKIHYLFHPFSFNSRSLEQKKGSLNERNYSRLFLNLLTALDLLAVR